MTTTQLTVTQQAVLTHAIHNTSGKIDWFPQNIKGGARKKVLDSLSNRALIAQQGTDWFVAAEGFDALGMPRSGPAADQPATETHDYSGQPAPSGEAVDEEIAMAGNAGASQVLANKIGGEDPTDAEIDISNDVDPEIEAAVAVIETTARAEAKKPRTRDNSKQATVIQMLQRPAGATVQQICDTTGWQAHTVRGTFAGAFKKKLGLTIVSHKAQGGERVYRIA
jgi:hypothetical protein